MYFKTTEAHEQLRAEIREWAEREIKPIALHWIRKIDFRESR